MIGTYSRVYGFGDDGIPASWREQYFGAGCLTDPRAAAHAAPYNDGTTTSRRTVGSAQGTVIAEVLATGERTTFVDLDAGVVANPAFYLVAPVD